jgi:hypothetical protein
MKLRPRWVLMLPCVLGAASTSLGQASSPPHCSFVGDDPVLEWNAIAVDTIPEAPPVPATRFMATTQLAVFEAVNAINPEYLPYLGELMAPAGASSQAAAAAAAHDVLVGFFPAAAATLDEKLAGSLSSIEDGDAKRDGILVGQEAAASMLAERTNDGSETPAFYLPPDQDAGDWQPTPSCPADGGVFEHWQHVKPFGVESSSQFRAVPPFPLTSRRYAHDFAEVKAVGDASSTVRPADRTNVALLYASQSAHIGWNSFARQLAGARDDSITDTARTLALLNVAIADAVISVFESKYHYNYWRPETAIARAAQDGNDETERDAAFTPLVVTPCFPSYPSGHGAAAGAASSVLADAYGEGGHDLTNATPSLPGVVLHYTAIDEVVSDVSDARVFGGIHFRNDQDAAEELGHEVAAYDLEHLLTP